MGEHDALGIGCGAGGIEESREVVIGGNDRLKASRTGGEDGIEVMVGVMVEGRFARSSRREIPFGCR